MDPSRSSRPSMVARPARNCRMSQRQRRTHSTWHSSRWIFVDTGIGQVEVSDDPGPGEPDAWHLTGLVLPYAQEQGGDHLGADRWRAIPRAVRGGGVVPAARGGPASSVQMCVPPLPNARGQPVQAPSGPHPRRGQAHRRPRPSHARVQHLRRHRHEVRLRRPPRTALHLSR